ncbi:MAG TPA: tetratricopeptide repeat protein [Anaerolineae bacterium]|nr:tetratricopeptide repeat protein [Anaerolineae bacterium]
MKDTSIQALLQQGITLAKAAHGKSNQQPKRTALERARLKKQAREVLIQVTELDARSVPAWLWLSTVIDSPADKRVCLENVLALEPDHAIAQKGLAQLELAPDANPQKSRPIAARPQPPSSSAAADPPSPPQTAQPNEISSSADGCLFCGRPLPSLASACPHCLAPLVIECPACNARMDVEWSHCTDCHQPLGDYRRGADYFVELATQYEQKERFRQAVEALQIAECLSPARTDLPGRLGIALLRLGRTDEAIDLLTAAVEQKPAGSDLYLALGRAYLQAKQPDKAHKTFKLALNIDPQSPAVHLALGDMLLERGDFKTACTHFQAATRSDPENGHAWAQLGTAYDELGQPRQAVTAYREAEARLSPELIAWQTVHRRLQILSPELPASIAGGWGEFTRQMVGPLLVCLLAVLLDSGLRPWWINWSGWLSLPLAGLGSLAWVSASLPQNPMVSLLIGPEAKLERSSLRPVLATVGLVLWLLAMGLIMLPVGQSFPEAPF